MFHSEHREHTPGLIFSSGTIPYFNDKIEEASDQVIERLTAARSAVRPNTKTDSYLGVRRYM